MADSAEGKKSKIFAIVLLLIVIIVMSFILGGSGGFFSIIGKLFWLIIIAMFLVIVGAVTYELFIKKHKIDVNYINMKNIVDSARLSKPLILGGLYLMGDKEHATVKLGEISGYTRIKNLDTGNPEDVFIVERGGFPLSLIGEPYVIRVSKDDHTELVGDVYLKGISLIKLGEFYYLNNVMDTDSIDKTHKQEAFRIVAHNTLSDMKGLMDIATGIDTEHKKKIEGTNLMQLPMSSGQQQQQPR